jgi:predicted dehydrogenase
MVRIGLMGFGYWGASLARNFQTAPASTLAGISDTNPERIAEAAALYAGAKTTLSANDLIGDRSLDAIAIATPFRPGSTCGSRSRSRAVPGKLRPW